MTYEPKTKAEAVDIAAFIAAIEPEKKRQDAQQLHLIFSELSKQEPMLWGGRMLGYGSYDYTSARGNCAGTWMRTGFSVSKAKLTLYIMGGFSNKPELLEKLGKHTTGASCLYINKLADVDLSVLKEIIRADLAYMDATYPN